MDLIPMAVDETAVIEQQPAIRAQLLKQLTSLVALCDQQIQQGEEEGHVDPRFAELKLRTLDRIARLYRLLEKPKPVEEDTDNVSAVGVEATRRLVLEQLRELEARAG